MTAPADISAKLVSVTPAIAVKLLEENKNNRRLDVRRVAAYAADMRRGAWQLNGEAIKVAASGRLLDGQTRLHAVIEADATIPMLVIYGLTDDVQESMDQGRARTLSDMLKMRGERFYSHLAAAVRIVAIYERDGIPVAMGAAVPLTVAECLRTLDHNPGLRESMVVASRLDRPWLPTSLVGALHYLFDAAKPTEDDEPSWATAFFEQVSTGEGLHKGDPPLTLRDRLISDRESKEKRRAGRAREHAAFVVIAWNAWVAGDQVRQMRWVQGGPNPQPFPPIAGLTHPTTEETTV